MKEKTALLGLFSALAILLGYVETLIPFFPGFYGIKLGLSNLVIVFLLYLWGAKEALLVSVVRILVIGFLFGNLFSILFSFAGALLSLFIMIILKAVPGFSVIGVSIGGGLAHNMGQLMVAVFLVNSFKLMYYLPVLMISGLLTGALVGIAGKGMLRRLEPLLNKNKGNKQK